MPHGDGRDRADRAFWDRCPQGWGNWNGILWGSTVESVRAASGQQGKFFAPDRDLRSALRIPYTLADLPFEATFHFTRNALRYVDIHDESSAFDASKCAALIETLSATMPHVTFPGLYSKDPTEMADVIYSDEPMTTHRWTDLANRTQYSVAVGDTSKNCESLTVAPMIRREER
jgi:hypothetical protein